MNQPRSLGPYFRELEGLRRRLESFLDQALVAKEYAGGEELVPGTWSPSVDLLESDEEYLLFAELPGVERSEIDLEVNKRRVVLAGRRPPPETQPPTSPESASGSGVGSAARARRGSRTVMRALSRSVSTRTSTTPTPTTASSRSGASKGSLR